MPQDNIRNTKFEVIRRYGIFGIGSLLAIVTVLLSIVYTNGVVGAWCDENAGQNDRCVAENYRDVVGNRVNESTYRQMIADCMSGEPDGLDFGSVDEGECANAAALCLQRSISRDKCTADNMATIANDCNGGRGTGGRSGCSKLSEMNDATVREASDAADKKAVDGCVTSGDPVQQFDQREACKKAVQDACKKPYDTNGSMNSDKKYNEYGFEDYQKCLDKAYYESAKNEEECKKRSGRWIGGTDGAQAPRCVPAPPSDPCQGRGDRDPATGRCRDGSDPGDNTARPPSGQIDFVENRCGEARVNILGCGDQGGNVALNNVLKIAAIVLSVAVGIAAVGGLAWASILYAQAQDNEGNVAKARELIRDIVIGLLLYVFLAALVNWLVPGGVFG